MVINEQIKIDSGVEDVWQILGRDFAYPYKWASAVHHSEGQGKSIATIDCDERACQTSMGNIREKITHFSNTHYTLSYDIIEGLPFFVANGNNKWQLTEESEGTSVLHIQMELNLKPWASFMAPLSEIQFKKLATQLAEDFAYYAENGSPHPRKIKAQRKHKPTNQRLATFYLLAFLAGTAIPLFFIIKFILEAGGLHLFAFINQLFANNAASTFSSDLLICSFVFWVFVAYDKKDKQLPNMLYFVILNLTIGLSSAFPLYLYIRERRKGML